VILKIPPMSDEKDRLIAWVSRESISGHSRHSLGRDLEHSKSKEGCCGYRFRYRRACCPVVSMHVFALDRL
jgi:hypothetical protein